MPYSPVNVARFKSKWSFGFKRLRWSRGSNVGFPINHKTAWDEIDLTTDIWEHPGERTKTGRPHRVPLNRPARNIIDNAAHRTGATGLVFPSPTGKPLSKGGHGLSLMVRPTKIEGRLSKTWVQRIRINGRETNLGLGSYPAVTLAEARRRALLNRQAVEEGRNPLARKPP